MSKNEIKEIRKKDVILLVAIIICFSIILLIIFFYTIRPHTSGLTTKALSNPNAPLTLYTDKTNNFTFMYPADWKISMAIHLDQRFEGYNCPASVVELLTPEKYAIDFEYNLDTCAPSGGYTGLLFTKSINENIYGSNVQKIYINHCADIRPQANCKDLFSEIYYTNTISTGSNGNMETKDPFFILNQKKSLLHLRLIQDQTLPLTDKNFDLIDKELDKIFSTIAFK